MIKPGHFFPTLKDYKVLKEKGRNVCLPTLKFTETQIASLEPGNYTVIYVRMSFSVGLQP